MTFDYENIPVGYYDRIYAAERGVQSKWHHLKFNLFRPLMRNYRRHLDIGCGAGTFIGSLLPGLHDSLGIDISRNQTDYANRQYGGEGRRFETVAAGTLPFSDASFDVVTTIELIEHLPENVTQSLLAECVRVLRPGGILLVSTPNYGSAWPLIEKIVNWRGGIDYSGQHINHYDRHRLRGALEEAGAGSVSVRGYMLLAPFAAALSWKLPEAIAGIEPARMSDRFGLLLFASGTKP
jgi:SAM-dependent methyltransferase